MDFLKVLTLCYQEIIKVKNMARNCAALALTAAKLQTWLSECIFRM